jgi:hypothetical protein
MVRTLRLMSRAALAALAWSAVAPAPAAAADHNPPLPRLGRCFDTRVARVETRLEGMAESGSAVSFRNGRYQVSYDTVAAVVRSRPGDPVRMCVVALPTACPPGDTRGVVYRTVNKRTGGVWRLPDAEHGCGGA